MLVLLLLVVVLLLFVFLLRLLLIDQRILQGTLLSGGGRMEGILPPERGEAGFCRSFFFQDSFQEVFLHRRR